MGLNKELAEFVDSIKASDEPWNLQIHHCVREAFDVIGLLLRAGENVDELANEAVAAASAVVAKLNLGPIAKRLATSAIPWVVPPLVEQMAGYTGTANEFVEREVTPRLELLIATLQDVAADLKGAA